MPSALIRANLYPGNMQKIDGITINSDLTALQDLHSFCEHLKPKIALDDQVHANMLLALSEAATNAIVHGNHNDPGKKVSVEFFSQSDQIVVKVSDEGQGFDPSSLPDPLSEENLLKQGGRGVFLIEQFADNVEFQDEGSTILLTFNKNSAG